MTRRRWIGEAVGVEGCGISPQLRIALHCSDGDDDWLEASNPGGAKRRAAPQHSWDAPSRGQPSGWPGPVYSLDPTVNPAGFSLAESLDARHLLILDGENTTVVRIELTQPEALDRLDLFFAGLS